MPKTSGYLQTFKVKDGDKDKNNKFISLRIDDEKLLDKYRAIWTMVEDSKRLNLLLHQSMDIYIYIYTYIYVYIYIRIYKHIYQP